MLVRRRSEKAAVSELPVLYSFRRCPWAMRARLALVVSGTLCTIREVALATKPPELLAASPKATVPVLVLADGEVVDESLDIMLWALRRDDPERWLEADPTATQSLIAHNDSIFRDHLRRYKYPERYDLDPVKPRTACVETLTTLEDRLSRHDFLCGATRSLADAALVPFVRQFAQVDRPWFDAQPLPHLQRWLALYLQSELFKAILVRLKPWQSDDVEIRFPSAGYADVETPPT